MRAYVQRLTIIFLTLTSNIFAEDIAFDDIIIVEIRAKDIGLKIKSASAFDKNREQRNKFRGATAEFLAAANKTARFILVDAWFPDSFGTPEEESLIQELKKNKKITLGGGSARDNEYTINLFAEAVPEVGHILFDYVDQKDAVFWPVVCADWDKFSEPITDCPEAKKQRSISLIALEGFTGKKFEKAGTQGYLVPRRSFSPFFRISYTEFKENPSLINDKLVILIIKPLPSSDMHKMFGNNQISGSEILANMIINYYYWLKPK